MNRSQRRAATEEHQRAISTINDMFDRLDELAAARGRLTGVVPLGLHDDPIRDAELLLAHAEVLNRALSDLRRAAVAALAHRRRSELAADIGTKPAMLFPRATGRDPEQADLTRDAADPGAKDHAGSEALQESAETRGRSRTPQATESRRSIAGAGVAACRAIGAT